MADKYHIWAYVAGTSKWMCNKCGRTTTKPNEEQTGCTS